jgi:hypothetical protein
MDKLDFAGGILSYLGLQPQGSLVLKLCHINML